MTRPYSAFLLAATLLAACGAAPTPEPRAFEPVPWQSGKDVVWVPSPPATVEMMLDLARVTDRDFVIDLGSGDGRNVIAAAKRGARGLGVEFNPDMVKHARRLAAQQGVADRAEFVEGDMFEADISKATALVLFLLSDNLEKLKPRFAALPPGTRIVNNGFPILGWDAEETARSDGDCGSWCTAYLYIVPANVAGTWRLPAGDLVLAQSFDALSGTLGGRAVTGRVKGDRIRLVAGLDEYNGHVKGDSIAGEVSGSRSGRFSAVRAH